MPDGDSALGDNGPVAEQAFWRLVDEGLIEVLFDGSAMPWIC